ncbi:caspase domain-containing protein [Streptomyces sp. NBC_01506]|uniref:caspase family protein n=1 Tax=Streptomyces sp. NBC_01506 TaxID=2903887 RepID=UPI00386D5179
MTEVWYPKGDLSRVVLIGAANYASDELPAIPAVHGNLASLRTVLADSPRALLPPKNCRVLGGRGARNPVTPVSVGTALASAAREATDLLLVYYSGHGLLDDGGRLHLALADTDPDPETVAFSAVPVEQVLRLVGRARARARVLVLDCCYSGRAVAAMATRTGIVADQLERSGTYTLTSTTQTELSFAPPGDPHTAFTGAMLRALEGPRVLTLDEIYHFVDDDLNGRSLPRPQRRAVNAAGDLALVEAPPAAPVAAPATPTIVPTRRPSSAAGREDPSGAPRTEGEIVFTRPHETREERRSALLIGSAVTAVLVVTTCVLWAAYGLSAAKWPAFFLPSCALGFALREKAGGTLTVDSDGVSVRGNPAAPTLDMRIPWADVQYMGLLHEVNAATTNDTVDRFENVILVRLQPDCTLVQPGLRGDSIARLGYRSLGRLKDYRADPVLLREAVMRFRPDVYRTNNELLDLDLRLSKTI